MYLCLIKQVARHFLAEVNFRLWIARMNYFCLVKHRHATLTIANYQAANRYFSIYSYYCCPFLYYVQSFIFVLQTCTTTNPDIFWFAYSYYHLIMMFQIDHLSCRSLVWVCTVELYLNFDANNRLHPLKKSYSYLFFL